MNALFIDDVMQIVLRAPITSMEALQASKVGGIFVNGLPGYRWTVMGLQRSPADPTRCIVALSRTMDMPSNGKLPS